MERTHDIKGAIFRKVAAIAAGIVVITASVPTVQAANTPQAENAGMPVDVPAKSAILLEQSTGQVLCEMNADEQMPPASITKIMTLWKMCSPVLPPPRF